LTALFFIQPNIQVSRLDGSWLWIPLPLWLPASVSLACDDLRSCMPQPRDDEHWKQEIVARVANDQGNSSSYHKYVNFLINNLPDILDSLLFYLSIKPNFLGKTLHRVCKSTPSSLVTQMCKGLAFSSHFPAHSNQHHSHTRPRSYLLHFHIKTKPSITVNLKLSIATA
jgi:hypothetical protein